ncbi:MAG: hypothetical protein ACM3ZT_02470 [Bacillota bacterium]
MLRQRLLAIIAALTLLAGCATDPHDSCSMQVPTQQGGIYIYDWLFLPVYLLYGITCEGIRALDRHGAFTPPTKGKVENGVYEAGDGSFSVAAPQGLEVREQYAPSQDYVFFAPRFARGPVYVVSVSPQLDPAYAALSLEQFAATSLRDANFENQRLPGAPLAEIHRENVNLNGQRALSVTYSQTPAGASRPSAYYLMYFMKTRDRAAALSIAWPMDCPHCATGPEAEVRTMDPQLRSFVESFRLNDSGTSN